MIIAIPYENGEIFQHFGKTQQFSIIQVEAGEIINQEIVDTNGAGHHDLGIFLADSGANVLICGGIGSGAVNFLGEFGIEVYAGNRGLINLVLTNFLEGKIEKNSVANCNHDECHHEGESCSSHSCSNNHCCK